MRGDLFFVILGIGVMGDMGVIGIISAISIIPPATEISEGKI